MHQRVIRNVFALVVVVMSCTAANAEAPVSKDPKPAAVSAARELVATIKFADKFNAIMPTIMKNLKGAMIQNRPEIEKDYDALTPVLLDGMRQRVGELQEAVALIYAANFTIDEMHAVTAFYKTPAGQSYLSKTVTVGEQTMAAGREFGQMVGAEAQKKMIDELRKKGHTI